MQFRWSFTQGSCCGPLGNLLMRCHIAKAAAPFVQPICCMHTVHVQELVAQAAFEAGFQNSLHEFLNSNSDLTEDINTEGINFGIITDVNA